MGLQFLDEWNDRAAVVPDSSVSHAEFAGDLYVCPAVIQVLQVETIQSACRPQLNVDPWVGRELLTSNVFGNAEPHFACLVLDACALWPSPLRVSVGIVTIRIGRPLWLTVSRESVEHRHALSIATALFRGRPSGDA
jgi:hypothetical protein